MEPAVTAYPKSAISIVEEFAETAPVSRRVTPRRRLCPAG